MKFTLKDIAVAVGGKISGNSEIEISGVSEIQNGEYGTISFLANLTYKKFMNETKASAVIVSDEDYLLGRDGIIVKNPQLAIAKVLSMFFPLEHTSKGIHPNAIIDESSILGKNLTIEAGVVIKENVEIGDDTYIGANTYIGKNSSIGTNSKLFQSVIIYHNVRIGEKVILHGSVVIGCDGFGFVTDKDKHIKIPQTGTVIIGDNVEIGSGSVIDRATIGETVIGDMCKIDNLVHIGHNVHIGKACLITAQVGIAGSSKIGDRSMFGGQAGVVPHIEIGSDSIVAAKSGVTKSLSGGQMYGGYPARPIKEQHKRDAAYNEIMIMKKKLNKLIYNSDNNK